MTLAPVCILAGGLGTRLGKQVRDTPKPLIEVAGKPFLEHQFDLLRASGAHRIVLCVGYLGERIEAVIGDGTRFGLDIRYRYDPPGLAGTAGAIRAALDDLGERFLVLYGDTYLRVDYAAVDRAARDWPALMCVYENAGRWDTSNVRYADGQVLLHDKRSPKPDMRWIDYGLSAFTPEALVGDETDLADLTYRLSAEGRLGGYLATQRFYEIGTPESLADVDAFLAAESEIIPRESSGEASA